MVAFKIIIGFVISALLTYLMFFLPSLYLEIRWELIIVSIISYVSIWILIFLIVDLSELNSGYNFEDSFVIPYDFVFNEIDGLAFFYYIALFIICNILILHKLSLKIY